MGVVELFGLVRGAAAGAWALTLLAAGAGGRVGALSARLGRRKE